MILWRMLLLLSVFAFLLVHLAECQEKVDTGDEEVDEIDDDGTVEVEDEDEPIEEVYREKPKYERPVPKVPVFFHEPFDSKESFANRWTTSQAKKDGAEESIAKYDGKWEIEEPKTNPMDGDLWLSLKSKAKHHAVSSLLDKPFEFTGKPLVVQYEVRFQNGQDCGGAYIKLLSKEPKMELKSFNDKTPYTIMFGPDKCGMDSKMHFIFRHKNPKTGEVEEKHAKKPSGNMDSYFSDRKTHLYTLELKPDQTFEVRVDNTVINKGSLLEDFSPPVNPPKEIEDPNDKKPSDWDDREKITDPDSQKPDDWDESEPATISDPDAIKPEGWLDSEPRLVPDPSAAKPDDWDDEMDGEWEAPLIDNVKCKDGPGCGEWKPPTIPNPKYRGKWSPPTIDNPNYKGAWKPRMIENPAYFEDRDPYKMTPIGAVGLELWSMSDDIFFDNFLVTDDAKVAYEFAAISWQIKSTEEHAASSAGGIWNTLMSAAKQRQWLWGLYVVVLLLPIVLLSICFCPKSGPVKPEDIAAERKKTDAPSPDDEGNDEEEEVKEENQEASKTEDAAKPQDVGGGGDSSCALKASQADLETEEAMNDGEEADAEEDEEGNGSPKKSPRRRKARKE